LSLSDPETDDLQWHFASGIGERAATSVAPVDDGNVDDIDDQAEPSTAKRRSKLVVDVE
jgi:hypothetical protein